MSLKMVFAVCATAVLGFPLVGCGNQSQAHSSPALAATPPQSTHPGNTDPKVDWIWVWEKETIIKRCDGTTMMYMHNGGFRESSPIGVVANDKACA